MRRHPIAILLLAVAVVLVAACSRGGTAPTVSGTPITSGTPGASAPTPVPLPSPSGAPSGGASSGGDSSSGAASPLPGDPGGGGIPAPKPTLVTPTKGLTGIHPVQATDLQTAVNGRHVAVKVAWWSGVEPCSVLAGVDVRRDGDTFTLTVREGSAAAPDTLCIEIAEYKATVVDLGELDPGTYTVTAVGQAPPVTVTVDG